MAEAAVRGDWGLELRSRARRAGAVALAGLAGAAVLLWRSSRRS